MSTFYEFIKFEGMQREKKRQGRYNPALPSKIVKCSIGAFKTLGLPFQISHQQTQPLVYPQPAFPSLEL